MRLKDSILQEIVTKTAELLCEYEQYVDEDGNIWDDEGNVTRRGKSFGRQYGGETYGTNAPWRGRSSKPRRTSYVGTGSNADKIKAVESALAAKPNNFLTSILNQLRAGRGLSGKQKGIVKRIIKKHDPAAADLFENSTATNEQLLRALIQIKLRKTST